MPAPASDAYAAGSYELGKIRLSSVTDDEAGILGAGLASIDPWRRMGYAPEALSDYLRRPDPAAFRYAIRTNGQLAGVISVRNPWLRGPYLELLGLFPQFHGHGIGQSAMDWFESEAPKGAGYLWVICSAFNTGALAFYKRCGFTEVTDINDLVFQGFTEILLRKPLQTPD